MDGYDKKALIILHDTVKNHYKELTKEQCKVIGEWFIKLSQVTITKELLWELDSAILDCGLDWIPNLEGEESN